MSEYIVRMPPDMPYEIKAELNAWYVESEPVVRCRDCAFMGHDKDGAYCTHFECWLCGEPLFTDVEPEGFCAWACRKPDEE